MAGISSFVSTLHDAVESALTPIMEASSEWGALIDPTEYLRDDPSFSWVVGPQNLRSDRANGDGFPIFRTEAELGTIRAIGRALGDCTEHGCGILETMASYILGCGYQWEVKPKNVSAVLASKRIQQFLEEYLESEKWPCNKEEEFLRRAVRDGEVFLAIMDRPGGGLCLRFIEPAQVTEPTQSIASAICERYGLEFGEWKYGIHTREGDVESVIGYFVQWNDDPNDYTYIPEFRMVHWKRNVDSNVKRGVSDFYPTRHGMRRAAKLQARLSDGGATQASIAWMNTLPDDATQEQVDAYIAKQAARTAMVPSPVASATPPNRTSVRSVATLGSSSVITVAGGTTITPGPLGHAEKATGFIEIFAAQLRTLGVRWNIPEYLVSADASNANYASTLTASSPFGRSRERDQFKLGQCFLELIRKLGALLVRKGEFRDVGIETPKQFKDACSITYTAPSVQVLDDLQKVTVGQGKIALGVPQKTVLKELGYQPEDTITAGAASPDGTVPAGSTDAASVADTALNGTQISSMREIVGYVSIGAMPIATAKAMMKVAFPTMDQAEIDAVLDPLEGFTPSVGPDGKPFVSATPGAAGAGGPAPATAAMSRLQQSRNFSTVLDLLNKVANGKTDPKVASVLMRQLAIPDDDIAELLGDASDGRVDSAPAPGAQQPAAPESAMDTRAGFIRITTESVHQRRLPRSSAIAQIAFLCGMEKSQAEELLGDAGIGTVEDEAAIVQRHLAKMWETEPTE